MKRKTLSIQLMGGFGNQVFQLSQALELLGKNETAFLYQRDPNPDIDRLVEEIAKRGIDLVRVNKESVHLSSIVDRCIGLLLAIKLGNRHIWPQQPTKFVLQSIAYLLLKFRFPIKGVYIARNLGFEDLKPEDREDFIVGYFQSFKSSSKIGRVHV